MSNETDITELAELRRQVKALTAENAKLHRQRDWAREYIMRKVPADAVRDRAFLREMWEADPGDQLADLIAELEAELRQEGMPDPPSDGTERPPS